MTGLLFYLGGFNNILMWRHSSALVTQKLAAVLPCLGCGAWGAVACGAATALQLTASVVFILGVPGYTRTAAWALLAFLVPVTAVVHDFWNCGHEAGEELVYVPGAAAGGTAAGKEAEAAEKVAATPGSPKGRGRASSTAARKRKASDAAPPATAAATPAAPAAAPPAPPAGAVPGPVPTFLREFDAEFVAFFKNVIAMGALVTYLALGPAE